LFPSIAVPERNESIAKPQISKMARVTLKFETRRIELVMNSAFHRDPQFETKSTPQYRDCESDPEFGHRSGWLIGLIVLGSGQVGIGGIQGCDHANADLCAAERRVAWNLAAYSQKGKLVPIAKPQSQVSQPV
jgi:hypothetical protein